ALFPILLFSAEILFFAAHLALLILFYGVDVNTNAIKTRAGYRPPLETPRFSLSHALRQRPAADCSRLKPCQACEPRGQWRRSCGDCLWLPIAERAPLDTGIQNPLKRHHGFESLPCATPQVAY